VAGGYREGQVLQGVGISGGGEGLQGPVGPAYEDVRGRARWEPQSAQSLGPRPTQAPQPPPPPGIVHASLPSRRPSPQQLRVAGVLGFGASLGPVSVHL
jgi:hypothetical protein